MYPNILSPAKLHSTGLEECDDNNTATGDGCSANCSIETDFMCTELPNPNVTATANPPVGVTGAPSACVIDICQLNEAAARLAAVKATAAATAAAVTAAVAAGVAAGACMYVCMYVCMYTYRSNMIHSSS
jgi:cysteine-rich repeat protein